jgi:hypothetical protein
MLKNVVVNAPSEGAKNAMRAGSTAHKFDRLAPGVPTGAKSNHFGERNFRLIGAAGGASLSLSGLYCRIGEIADENPLHECCRAP